MLRSLDKVLQLEIHAFFDYIKTIRYGYRDREGCVHVMEVSDDDSKQEECFAYVFSSPEEVTFGSVGFSDLQKCVLAFSGEFVGYLKSVLQGDYDEKYFLLKEYSCEIRRGISDGEYLALVRGDGGAERKI